MPMTHCLLCLTSSLPNQENESKLNSSTIQITINQLRNLLVPNSSHQIEDNSQYNVCKHCSIVTEEIRSFRSQISELEVQIRKKVVQIRQTIIDSTPPKNGGVEDLIVIRESLLVLTGQHYNEALNYEPTDANVKVETNHDQADFSNNFFDDDLSFSPANLGEQEVSPLKEECIEKYPQYITDDDDFPFHITPDNFKEGVKTRGRKRKAINYSELEHSKSKKIKLEKTTKPTPIKPKSIPRHKAPAKKKLAKLHSPNKTLQIKSPPISSESEGDESDLSGDDDDDDDDDYVPSDSDQFKKNSRLPYKCNRCNWRSFNTEEELNRHVEKDHTFQCSICPSQFGKRKEFHAHLKKEHKGVTPFKCDIGICNRRFWQKETFQTHMVMKHETGEKIFPCSKCDKKFCLELNLQNHFDQHDLEGVICDFCDSRFLTQSRLATHVENTHKELRCEFEHCEFQTSKKKAFERHVRLHTGEKPYKCDHCPETFIDYSAKQRHTDRDHTPNEGKECPICHKVVSSTTNLKIHVDRMHDKIHKKQCDTCGKKFMEASSLQAHEIRDHGKDPWVCEECGATFVSDSGLKRHKLRHKGDKPFECDLCDARFMFTAQLTQHKKYHLDERPHLCPHCGFGFKARKHLNIHIKRIHTPGYVAPTPHKCPHCEKAFPRKCFMEAHVRQVHTGERPFVCGECGKGFAIKTTLDLHLRTHGIMVARRAREKLPKSKRDTFPQAEDEDGNSE